MKHPGEIETIEMEIASSDKNMNGHIDKMEVLSEMSANILNGKNNHNGKSHSIDSVEAVVDDLKNIKIDNVNKSNSDDNNNNNSSNNNDNNNKNSDIHTSKQANHEQKNDAQDGEGEVGRRKSKRLKKIRIEKKKQRKEARKMTIETVKTEDDGNDNDKNDTKEETPVIEIETIPGLPQFVNIDENIYLFSRNKARKNKIQCDCTLTREEKKQGLRGCEDGCLNRMLNYECSSNCPVGKRCANKRFQKKEYAKIIPFKTEMKGWGLKALEDIGVNVFIMEYVGEVIDAFDFHDRVDAYAAEKIEHYYFMSLKKDEIIDSTKKGNITRFINHSCEPNCVTQKWVANSEDRIGFFSIRPIKKGEELTFDYQFQRYGEKAQKCYCGTPSCRGFIGNANSGPSILTDGTKIDDKLQSELDNEPEPSQEDIIEEFYQMYNEDGIDNMKAVQDIMKVIVQTDLTNPYLQGKIISVLLATKTKAYLKLFVDYRCLIFFWVWMKDTKDLSLKIDCLKLLKILPLDNRTILVENKVFHLVEMWSKNPKKNHDDSLISDAETENEYRIIQELSQELIKNWEALPEAARIPKSLKIKMRQHDEQKAKNEEEITKKKENYDRRKEIRENLRKYRQVNGYSLTSTQPAFEWSTYNRNNHESNNKTLSSSTVSDNNFTQTSDTIVENNIEEQEKAKMLHRKMFEQKIAEFDYAQAMKRYDIEVERWKESYRKHLQETGQGMPILQENFKRPTIEDVPEMLPVTEIVSEKNESKQKKLDFLLDSFDKLKLLDDSNNELDEGLSFLDFNDIKFASYKHIYDHRTIIIKSDFNELLNTKPNLTLVMNVDNEYDNNHIPPEYVDILPLNDITYQSDDIFESMDKTIFDATYPYQGAYINLDHTQYMQGIQENSNGPDIVCKEILAQPLPISFTKNKLFKVPRPWRIRKTEDGHYFYYNPIKMFTQWSHPLVDPSESVSLNNIESVLNGNHNQTNKTKTVSQLTAEQLRRNKLNNSIILKKGEQRTKERLERQKQKYREAQNKKEEELFRLEISKYVVKCLNPHMSTKDKKRKIQTKEEFKKIAEKFTNIVVQKEINARRNSNKKLSITDGIKIKIKQKVKDYLHVK